LVVVGLAMLSVFSLLTSYLFVLLPVGRFGGLLGLVAAGGPPAPRRAGREPATS
jgi:hypothetical protein